jgi:hypothetical protein
MRRVGFAKAFLALLSFLVVADLPLLAAPTRSLTAEDQAFLSKKIIARWTITAKGQVEAAYARGIDILEDHPNPAKGSFTILVDQDELDGLRADGYDIKVLDPDWYGNYASKSTETMGGFLTFSEGVAKLDSFHTAFPSITTAKFSIGTTVQGDTMWAIKISDNPNVDENEPEILFTGLHHAREPIGPELLMETMRRLLFNYGTDTMITRLVNEREIYFVPYVNPDGYLYNEATQPLGGGMWRKNRLHISGSTYGVDVNRNYGYDWGIDNLGSSPVPSDETYRGAAAFSEMENQNMRAFINARHFVIACNYHSYANLFLWPPGYAAVYAPDQRLFAAIGDSVVTFNGFLPEVSWGLYLTNGDSDDWGYFATNEHGKILSFTPEVGSDADGPSPAYGFWPYPSRIPALVQENIAPNLLLIDLADTPERILPPAVPTWVAPDNAAAPDYTLSWSDPGGINAAVSYEVDEAFGPHQVTDNVEGGLGNWQQSGFSQSSTRSYSSTHSFYGGNSNDRNAHLTASQYYRPAAGDSVRARVFYDTEPNWDYLYVEVSPDFGQNWFTLPGNLTTNSNPNGPNHGNGVTGSSSGAFVHAAWSLGAYAGQDVRIRFSYVTDQAVTGEGVYLDDISPVPVVDSTHVLDASHTVPNLAITGKLPGTYYYTLKSTDAQGQKSTVTPLHPVAVNYTICSCPCANDPACDAATDILDVTETINVAFRGGTEITDSGCPKSRTDVNCSGETDVLDVTIMINVAFRGASSSIFCNPCAP